MALTDGKQSQAAPVAPTSPSQPQTDERSRPILTDGFDLPEIEAPDEAPPPYGERPDQLQFSQPGFNAGAEVTDDGRINININTKNRRLRDLLAPAIDYQAQADLQSPLPPAYIPPNLGGKPGQAPPPKLNIVVQIVGSRGDVQPFVALGKVLKDTYGHRIRIATHATFKSFVEDNGLEFFCIGGDPAELMAFMVKHPGLMPGFDALKSGEVSKRRRGIQSIMMGCWRSCTENGDGLGPPPKPHSRNEPLDLSQTTLRQSAEEPFVADAIIANPPSFAHIHIAEKLGIPLHMMFTMPWSPTRAFPHPLADIQSSNADDVMTNYLTYTLVEMMTWQGLGDIINRFRTKVLDLSPLSLIWAPGLLNRLKIPYTYCWSPALIPKPQDWGRHIDISGFYFLNLASSYTPDPELAAFLESGPPPVYIGFGSIVVDDPNAMTRMIFDAIHLSGVRALVSKGWGGLGADDVGIPEGVFMLGNVPHDWLFERVSCVVHHGGAGTTAAGIKAGKPTIVVPFFGDQPFWGAMIARAKAGPDPIPYKNLTAEKLAESIKFCLEPQTLEQAQQMGQKIREEKGADMGGQYFHDHLDIDSLRCSLAPSRVAVWRVRRSQVRLSALAMAVLVEQNFLEYSDVKLYRAREHNTEAQPPDPISAGASSLVMDMSSIGMAVADMPRELFKSRKKTQDGAAGASTPGQSSATGATGTDATASGLASRSDVGNASMTTEAASSKEEPTSSSADASSLKPLSPSETQTSLPSTDDRSKTDVKQKGVATQPEEQQPSRMNVETITNTGRGVEKIVTTGVKSPMNFCLGLAKGFRNIPRLYNDDTVRPVEKVTDFSSGMKVASKELGYGLYDGISGLVTQPLRGAEKQGASGLFKGFGKGIGGLIAKPAAGFWGVPAYAMQGVHAEINKFFTRSLQNYIITSRVVQGERDLERATIEEKRDIVMRWNDTGGQLKPFYQLKNKQHSSKKSQSPMRSPGSSLSALDEKKKLRQHSDLFDTADTGASGAGGANTAVDSELEQAIQASVRETSKGNPEEDARIEAAMRESINAMRGGQGESQGGEYPLEKSLDLFADPDYQIDDEEYQDLVEQAIQRSLIQHAGEWEHPPEESGVWPGEGGASGSGTTSHPPPVNDDQDDADLQRALAESRSAPTQHGASDENDEELQKAIAASKDHMQQEESQRNEEEIVMEYIKKQSLAEEEMRKKATKGKDKAGGEGEGEDDEDLKRAIEESLKGSAAGEGSSSQAAS